MEVERNRFKRTKFACYMAYFTMSSVFSLPPLLFITLREQYGISYTLLGTLVLTNFCTQLTVDLIFTFFSKKINVAKIVRVMPLITSAGLFTYQNGGEQRKFTAKERWGLPRRIFSNGI